MASDVNPLNDPDILALPHPVRVDAALGEPLEVGALRALGLLEGLKPYLGDIRVTTEWLLNRVPGMAEAAIASVGAPGSFNLGAFLLLLARARLRAHGDPILEVSAPLQALLAETDLAEGLPARFFRCPYPVVYVAFARPCPLTIYNRASGRHEVEGAYVGSYLVPPGHELHERTGRAAALGIDPRRPTRVIELTITGSPIGKHNALDDASHDLALFIQDEDACLDTLLARHNAYYASPAACDTPGFEPPRPEEVAMSTAVIAQLAKVLLYLNLPEAEQQPLPERSELERRLRQLGPKKAARLKRRLPTAYDRILIGPTRATPSEAAPAATGSEPHRSLRPHWRRGHFRRIRYGEQLSESRLGWIRPVLVNASEAFGAVKAKPYVLR
jgi:hypothetical protein